MNSDTMSNSGPARQSRPVGWTGWVFFAGAICFVNGMFSVTQGLILLFGPDTYTSMVDGELIIFDVSGWAWWNVIIGALLLATGGALFSGATWARVVAVIVAIISAVTQLLLIPVQPFWSLIVIAIDVLVIYAIVVHGNEIADDL
jgi:hypothetical protein